MQANKQENYVPNNLNLPSWPFSLGWFEMRSH